MTRAWAAGWNLPGYLSDSPESVLVTKHWGEAQNYLREALDRWIDAEYDYESGQPAAAEEALDSLNAAEPGKPWLAASSLGYAVWIEPTDETPDDER